MKRAIRVRFKSHVLPPHSPIGSTSGADKRIILYRIGSILYRRPPPTHSFVYICFSATALFLRPARVFLLWQVRNIFTLFTKIKTIPQYFLTAAAATAAPVFPSSTSVFFAAAACLPLSWRLGIGDRRMNFPKNFSSVNFWSVSWQRAVPSVVASRMDNRVQTFEIGIRI